MSQEVRVLVPVAILTLYSLNPQGGDPFVADAVEKVKLIVNQPVIALPRYPSARVAVYSPGWFHPGAVKPDFANVDIRKTQDLQYARHEYVTSDVNPGVMFRGVDVEFNSMTKYFYTDRSLPKKRLSEGEMLEINRLYRIIARAEPPAQPATRAALPPPASSSMPFGYGAAALSAVALLLAGALWLLRRRASAAR